MYLPRWNPYPTLEAAVEGTTAPPERIKTLALVDVDYINFQEERKVGQLVVAEVLAEEIQLIFGAIRDGKFPIKSVIPIAFFGHSDSKSIGHDNTSAFNNRNVAGTDRLSKHSYGTAIDINPWLNPYLNLDGSPISLSARKRPYNPQVSGTIVDGGVVVRAFSKYGWLWGGHWKTDHDYQHFNKDLPPIVQL